MEISLIYQNGSAGPPAAPSRQWSRPPGPRLLRRRLYQLWRARLPSALALFFSCLLQSERILVTWWLHRAPFPPWSFQALSPAWRIKGDLWVTEPRRRIYKVISSGFATSPRSFASLFLQDAGGGWGSLITRLVVKRHMLALKDIWCVCVCIYMKLETVLEIRHTLLNEAYQTTRDACKKLITIL